MTVYAGCEGTAHPKGLAKKAIADSILIKRPRLPSTSACGLIGLPLKTIIRESDEITVILHDVRAPLEMLREDADLLAALGFSILGHTYKC